MIPRFRHILIPLDFTEKNLAALNIAFDLAVVNHAVTTLLHVVEKIQGDQDAEVQQFYDRLRNRAEAELETLSQRFDEANLIVERKVRIGKRLNEIVIDSVERTLRNFDEYRRIAAIDHRDMCRRAFYEFGRRVGSAEASSQFGSCANQ